MTFDKIIEIIFQYEGGYVNDPTDRGGETKFGISKRAHPDINIRDLTKNLAREIYRVDYWIPSRAGKLPVKLRGPYFDMCVNHGQRNAVRILQQACNGRGEKIAEDGLIGPQTIGACAKLEKKRLISYRCLFFARIVQRDPEQERFWYGWFRRAVSFM